MKEVDIFAHSHWPNDPYLADIPAQYDVFIIEDMTVTEISDVFNHFATTSHKKRTFYERDMEKKLHFLKKQWTKLVIGDFSHDNEIVDLAVITSHERYLRLFEKTCLDSTFHNIKAFYAELWWSERLRNDNFVANIAKEEGYIWVRFWTTHAIIVRELKRLWYDILLSIDPTLYDYHITLLRKIYLQQPVLDGDYYKWRASILILSLLQRDEEVQKNIYGKSFGETTAQQDQMIHAFFNCLIDGLSHEELKTITYHTVGRLFTYNNITSPLKTRIKRQEIRDFLKNFSIKKYGTTVYYDWLEKQGIIY